MSYNKKYDNEIYISDYVNIDKNTNYNVVSLKEVVNTDMIISNSDDRVLDMSGMIIFGSRLNDVSGITVQTLDMYMYESIVCGCSFNEYSLLKDCVFVKVIFLEVDFSNVHISGCKFIECQFLLCNFYGVNTDESTFLNTVNTIGTKYLKMICPEYGYSYKGYAKGIVKRRKEPDITVEVELLIPSTAKRISGSDDLCRSDMALVVDIKDREGNTYSKCISAEGSKLKYKSGKYVKVNEFNSLRYTCNPNGIFHYIEKELVYKGDNSGK